MTENVVVAEALVEALAALESLACITKVEMASPSAWSPTREQFDILRSGGLAKEGDCAPIVCCDALTAVRFWKSAALEYASTRAGTLYWRTTPEMSKVEFHASILGDEFDMTWYSVYSRLLISDKPRIDAAA